MLTPVIPPAGFPVPPTAPLARDVFADYLKRRGGHLSEEQFRDAANPRLMLPGPLPVTCKAHSTPATSERLKSARNSARRCGSVASAFGQRNPR